MVPFVVPRIELALFVHRGTIGPSDARSGMLEAREGFTLAGGMVKPMALPSLRPGIIWAGMGKD